MSKRRNPARLHARIRRLEALVRDVESLSTPLANELPALDDAARRLAETVDGTARLAVESATSKLSQAARSSSMLATAVAVAVAARSGIGDTIELLARLGALEAPLLSAIDAATPRGPIATAEPRLQAALNRAVFASCLIASAIERLPLGEADGLRLLRLVIEEVSRAGRQIGGIGEQFADTSIWDDFRGNLLVPALDFSLVLGCGRFIREQGGNDAGRHAPNAPRPLDDRLPPEPFAPPSRRSTARAFQAVLEVRLPAGEGDCWNAARARSAIFGLAERLLDRQDFDRIWREVEAAANPDLRREFATLRRDILEQMAAEARPTLSLPQRAEDCGECDQVECPLRGPS